MFSNHLARLEFESRNEEPMKALLASCRRDQVRTGILLYQAYESLRCQRGDRLSVEEESWFTMVGNMTRWYEMDHPNTHMSVKLFLRMAGTIAPLYSMVPLEQWSEFFIQLLKCNKTEPAFILGFVEEFFNALLFKEMLGTKIVYAVKMDSREIPVLYQLMLMLLHEFSHPDCPFSSWHEHLSPSMNDMYNIKKLEEAIISHSNAQWVSEYVENVCKYRIEQGTLGRHLMTMLSLSYPADMVISALNKHSKSVGRRLSVLKALAECPFFSYEQYLIAMMAGVHELVMDSWRRFPSCKEIAIVGGKVISAIAKTRASIVFIGQESVALYEISALRSHGFNFVRAAQKYFQ